MERMGFQGITNIMPQDCGLLRFVEDLFRGGLMESNYLMIVFGITKIILQFCDKQILYPLLNPYNTFKRSIERRFEITSCMGGCLRIAEKPTSLSEGRGLALWVFTIKLLFYGSQI